MKSRHLISRPAALLIFTAVFVMEAGCTQQSTLSEAALSTQRSYVLPSSSGAYDAGKIHNAQIAYIFSHYDTVKYANYPNKFSETGIDSLAALFITDSLQTGSGPLTSAEISMAEAAFDSVFHACLSAPLTHSQFVTSISTAEANGLIVSDEGDFLIRADTDLRLCTSFAETNDSIASLMSQYNATTWASSPSHGVDAYEFLNVANASCHLWGGPSGNGGSGDPIDITAHPVPSDAEAYTEAYHMFEVARETNGMTEGEVIILAQEYATAASSATGLGPTGTPIAPIIIGVCTVVAFIIAIIIFL